MSGAPGADRAPTPRANSAILGQARALDVLARACATGRLPHAWLLAGPKGVGKATLGYRFARALLADGHEAGSAGAGLALAPDHPVFRQVAAGTHPDLRVIETTRDPRTGKLRAEIGVDAVRAATAALHATAAMGGYRVLLVDAAEQLNRNAANALLKSLEEPPPRTVIILIAHVPGRVAPTLKSRCARLPLARLPDQVVIDGLTRLTDLDHDACARIAVVARGSLGRALTLAADEGLAVYHRLALAIDADPVDRGTLAELALELARRADAAGLASAIAPIQELLSRVVGTAAGRSRDGGGVALFADEPAALERLARRRPLARWADLSAEVLALGAAIDGLNLDRNQTLLHMLTMLAPGIGHDNGSVSDGAPLGAGHVRG